MEFSLYEISKAGHVIRMPAAQNKKKIFSEKKYAAANTVLQKSHCEWLLGGDKYSANFIININ